MRVLFIVIALFTLSLGINAAPSQAAQGYEIMSSNIDSLKRGEKFPKDGAITLPLGAEITFLTINDQSGAQRICVGPYTGPIATCKGKEKPSFWCRLTGRCGSNKDPVSGAQRSPRKDRPTVGGTRGMIRKIPPKE